MGLSLSIHPLLHPLLHHQILENDESIEQQSSDKDVVTVTQQEANPKKSGCC